MKPVFADAFYWIALTNSKDKDRERALGAGLSIVPRIVITTDEVLTEFLAFCADSRLRVEAAMAVQDIPAKDRGWNRLTNGDLLAEAERAGFDALLTADKNMRYQQNLTGRRIALVVLSTPQWPLVRLHLDIIAAAVNAATPRQLCRGGHPVQVNKVGQALPPANRLGGDSSSVDSDATPNVAIRTEYPPKNPTDTAPKIGALLLNGNLIARHTVEQPSAADRRYKMSLFLWIVLGLIAGFIASHIVDHRGEGMVLDILLGIVGGIVGGWVFHMVGHEGVNGLNLHSMFVATIGAILFLFLYHAIRPKRRYF